MTTDPRAAEIDTDRAARLAVLRERSRGAREAATPGSGSAPTMLPAGRPRPRQGHAALGGRMLTAGLSVGAALGLMTLMADGQVALATSALATPSPTTTAVAIVPGSPQPVAAVPAVTTAGAPSAPGPIVPVTTVAARPGPTAARSAGAPVAQASGGAVPSGAQPAAAAPAPAPVTAAPAPVKAAPAPPPVTIAAGS